MTTYNIDLFDKCVTIILVTLYKKFPVQTELSFNNLASEIWEDGNNFEKHFDKQEVVAHTVNWLKKAGYIWADKVNEYDANNVVLSPSGLELMKMPSSLSDSDSSSQKSIGNTLIETMKSGTEDVAKDLMKKALTEGFKLLIS